jgi:hypothetical protein
MKVCHCQHKSPPSDPIPRHFRIVHIFSYKQIHRRYIFEMVVIVIFLNKVVDFDTSVSVAFNELYIILFCLHSFYTSRCIANIVYLSLGRHG